MGAAVAGSFHARGVGGRIETPSGYAGDYSGLPLGNKNPCVKLKLPVASGVMAGG